jgi:predicted transcriptional regulator
MVNEFIGRVFSGSAKPLLVHLVDDAALDHEELAEIEARLKEKRGQRKADGAATAAGKRKKGEKG